ncbi:hypothetical protein EXIGLDRAFT_749574 [Exidia glandulosa HHB12029]|uniref:Uncharacterized protein n=1 Tax=Exidia glandulosa HHB12029 TaxID=1314781 RepID=A0A165HXV4_EXIGL|nr:hypothetical protein EXIGLDRAFT_749574 [Exidia glandulosa HHB12029]
MSAHPRRKKLPPGINYVGGNDDDVCCDACDKIMQYTSLRNHLNSKGHATCVASDAAAEVRAHEEDAQYQALFDDSEPVISNYMPPPAPSNVMASTSSRPTDPGLLVETENTLASYAEEYSAAHAAPDPSAYQQRQAEAVENLTLDLTLLFLHDELTAHIENEDATTTADAAAELRHERDNEPALTDEDLRSAMKGDWAPYPTKTMFHIDLLDNLPRLRMSDAQLRMVLWTMSQCGARDVPSLWKLRKWQGKLQDSCPTETLSHRSTMGNIFYSNNICGTIAMESSQDFAKPSVAKLMRHYPEISSQGVSEVRHADRWAGVDLKARTIRELTAAEVAALKKWNDQSTFVQMCSTRWAQALNVTSRTGDVCAVESWICFEDATTADQTESRRPQHIGRISEVLTPSGGHGLKGVVKVQQYTIGTHLHPTLDMPVLKPGENIIIPATNTLFIVNVQHDCITAKCSLSGSRTIRQERQDSTVQVPAWAHTDKACFVINTHALHNALQLREMLPRALTQPRPIWSDRNTELQKLAGTALQKFTEKEQRRQEKSKATRKRNQQNRNDAQEPAAAAEDETGMEEEQDEVDEEVEVEEPEASGSEVEEEEDLYESPSPSPPPPPRKRRRRGGTR